MDVIDITDEVKIVDDLKMEVTYEEESTTDEVKPVDVQETEHDYKEAFSPYDISEVDAKILVDVIIKYKAGEDFDYFEALPDIMKPYAEGLRIYDDSKHKMSKKQAAKLLLDNFINDAKINKAIDDYAQDLNSTMTEMSEEYSIIFKESLDSIFDNIDKIREEDPEKADKIERVKKAFDDSTTFQLQYDYVMNHTANKIKKLSRRYDEECIYFNTRVNKTSVKVPDINELLTVIKYALPQYDEEDIKRFLVVVSKSTNNLLPEKNIEDLAYIYKLVSNIYNYKFTADLSKGQTLFENISRVIDIIINHP